MKKVFYGASIDHASEPCVTKVSDASIERSSNEPYHWVPSWQDGRVPVIKNLDKFLGYEGL